MSKKERARRAEAERLAERRKQALRLYVEEGLSYRSIAAKLGVGHDTVMRDIKEELALIELDKQAMRMGIILRDEQIIESNWGDALHPPTDEKGRPYYEAAGVIDKIHTRWTRMAGLNEAEKREITGPGGGPQEHIARLSPEEVEEMRRFNANVESIASTTRTIGAAEET